jgi:hypothetical protein
LSVLYKDVIKRGVLGSHMTMKKGVRAF